MERPKDFDTAHARTAIIIRALEGVAARGTLGDGSFSFCHTFCREEHSLTSIRASVDALCRDDTSN